MSTAYNHMKRSHRSQRAHYNANSVRLYKTQVRTSSRKDNFLSRMAQMFRGRTTEP